MKIFNRLVMCMDTVAVLPHARIDSLHTHTMDKLPTPWISPISLIPNNTFHFTDLESVTAVTRPHI